MKDSGKLLIAQTLQARASRDVPDDIDGWPVILGKIQPTPPSLYGTRTHTKNRATLAYGTVGVCVLLMAVLLISLLYNALLSPTVATAAEVLKKAQTANIFVPAGQVRHLVVSTTESSVITNFVDQTSMYEVWLTNGPTHLLLRKRGPNEDAFLLVGEDSVWDYNPGRYPGVVRTYAYDPDMLKNFVPNVEVVEQMMQMPNTHVVQNATLNGRSVLLLEQTGEAEVGSVPSQDNSPGLLSYRIWLDKSTFQVLQHQHALREVQNGVFTDKVDTGLSTIVVDEVKNIGDYPAGLFTFAMPADSKLQVLTDPASPNNP